MNIPNKIGHGLVAMVIVCACLITGIVGAQEGDSVSTIPGLIAHYTFDIDARDDSGNDRDGSLMDGAKISTGLLGAGSLDLRSGDGFVTIENPILNALPSCSMSFWINFDSVDIGDDCCLAIFAEDESEDGALHVNLISDQRVEWALGTGEVTAMVPFDGASENWTHYAWTYNAGFRDVFINGNLVVDSDFDPSIPACGNEKPSTIGAWNEDGQGAFDRFLNARIDDLRFYDRMLSGEEVIALSQQPALRVLQGAWLNPETPGQGHLFDPLEALGLVFGAWFTYDDSATKVGSPDNRWFTMLFSSEGATLSAPIVETSGGVLDTAQEVVPAEVGQASIRINDCRSIDFNYAFNDGPSRTFAMEPLSDNLGVSGATCQ